MRTFSPCWKVLTVLTGVPKSITSRRRRRLSGSEVLRNSTTRFWPCWRMSIPVVVSDISTTTRPSPARPRRKSTSRIACLVSARPSAKLAIWPPGIGCACCGSASVISTSRPSMVASCGTARRRFSTRRVRSVPCTTFMLRRSPWPMSCDERPSALTVLGKSKAMRAGLATAKFGGTLRSGSLVVTRTTVLPPTCVTSKDSMLFCCASASPQAASHSRKAERSVLVFIFVVPPPVGARSTARPTRRCRPAPAPSA